MLFITNDDVNALLTMEDCMRVQEEAFYAQETGAAIHRPRIDMYAPCDREDSYYRWGTMEGWYDGIFAIRMKSDIVSWPGHGHEGRTEEKHCIEPGTYCGLIMLFASGNGAPLAIMNDGVLQHMRVGAGAGIGVRHLARKESRVVGMLGSGGMAQTYLEAFRVALPGLETVKVYSPTQSHREAFAREMSARHDLDVIPVDSAREAVRGADILSTNTDSMTPTFEADWLEPGMHVTMLGPCEISNEAEARFDVRIRQGVGGLRLPETRRIRMEVGMSPLAYIAGSEEEMRRLPPKTPGKGFGGDYPDYCDLVSGRARGRTRDDQITFYHNMGNQGLQFAAVAGLVYRLAVERNRGQPLPAGLFVQDIRD